MCAVDTFIAIRVKVLLQNLIPLSKNVCQKSMPDNSYAGVNTDNIYNATGFSSIFFIYLHVIYVVREQFLY